MARRVLVEKEETGSTNDDARALGLAGAPHGATVLARRQLAGRGREGRAFASPDGGIYLSVLLRLRSPPAQWGLLPLSAGLAAARALRARGFDARVKWPNDVMIDRRKMGGILVESHLGAQPFAVVGIGLNVRASPLPEATCLAAHGSVPDERALAEELRAAVLEEAAAVDAGAGDALLARLRPLCMTLGKRVDAGALGEAVAVDIDANGALVVEQDGRRTRIVAGDVRLREK